MVIASSSSVMAPIAEAISIPALVGPDSETVNVSAGSGSRSSGTATRIDPDVSPGANKTPPAPAV